MEEFDPTKQAPQEHGRSRGEGIEIVTVSQRGCLEQGLREIGEDARENSQLDKRVEGQVISCRHHH